MHRYSLTERIEAPAERVWATVADFGDDSWTGVAITLEGEGVGAVRTVAMPTGPVRERCEALDHEAMVLTYAIVSGNPLPADALTGTMAIRPEGDGCVLEWSAEFEAADPAAVEAGLARLYPYAVAALRRHVEA